MTLQLINGRHQLKTYQQNLKNLKYDMRNFFRISFFQFTYYSF